jgi:hypothetical protein
MSMTRRSLFGLLGGALASLGLDGPAKTAAAYASTIEKRLRPQKVVVYVFSFPVAPNVQFSANVESGDSARVLLRGLSDGSQEVGLYFWEGVVLSPHETIRVWTWNERYDDKKKVLEFNGASLRAQALDGPPPDRDWHVKWESL